MVASQDLISEALALSSPASGPQSIVETKACSITPIDSDTACLALHAKNIGSMSTKGRRLAVRGINEFIRQAVTLTEARHDDDAGFSLRSYLAGKNPQHKEFLFEAHVTIPRLSDGQLALEAKQRMLGLAKDLRLFQGITAPKDYDKRVTARLDTRQGVVILQSDRNTGVAGQPDTYDETRRRLTLAQHNLKPGMQPLICLAGAVAISGEAHLAI